MQLTQIYNEYLYEGLNQSSRRSMRLWEGAAIQLKEAALTPDQIQQIFTSVEQGATAAGGNRTMIGQSKDAAAAVSKAWEDLKTKVQNSGPIKNVDSAYDSAVAKIEAGLGGSDNAVNQVIQKYRAFAKAHPVAQGLIYAALIAAAGISGAGLGGAAVLGLLKMTDKLLQGEKFSSAAYQGAKTGGMAYAAGQIGQAMKGNPEGGASAAQAAVGNVGPRAVAKGAMEIVKQKIASGEVTDYNSYQQAMSDAITQAATSGAKTASYQSQQIAYKMLTAQLNQVAAQAAGGEISGSGPEIVSQIIQSLGGQVNPAAMGQAVNAAKTLAASNATFESIKLSESQIATLFTLVQIKNRQFNEGMWDTIKNKAATVGKNLTTKITADKLSAAWKKSGSPTDSNAVAQVIQSAGVDSTVVSKTYADMGIESPSGRVEPTLDQPAAIAAPTVNTKDMLAQIMKLTPAEQQQVLAQLKK